MTGPERDALGSVLILGATGFLGLNLVETMLRAGLNPLCLHRPRANTIPLRRLGAERVVGDLDDPTSLRGAMRGVDTVLHLAGHYPRHGRDPAEAIATATRQLGAVLDACADSGVRRLVFVSSTATVRPRRDGAAATDLDIYPDPPGIGAYHDAKWHMEAMALAETRFEVSIACPGACLGAWDLRVGTSALLIGAARGTLEVWPDGIVNLVAASDVAEILVRLGSTQHPPRRLLIASIDTRLSTLLPLAARYFHAPAPPAPTDATEAIAFADAEEARVAGAPARPRLVREIADLVVHGSPLDTRLAAAYLGRPWQPLSRTLERFGRFARKLRMLPPESAPPPPGVTRALDDLGHRPPTPNLQRTAP